MLVSLVSKLYEGIYKMATVDINALVVTQAVDENSSKKAMVYTSDTGAIYVVNVTESIGEALGFLDYETGSLATAMPDGLTMRKITFSSSNGKVSGSYPCGSPQTPAFVEGGTITVPRKGSAVGVVCAITGAQGEKRRLLSANDTGQNSGDAT